MCSKINIERICFKIQNVEKNTKHMNEQLCKVNVV